MITYAYWDYSLSVSVKGTPDVITSLLLKDLYGLFNNTLADDCPYQPLAYT